MVFDGGRYLTNNFKLYATNRYEVSPLTILQSCEKKISFSADININMTSLETCPISQMVSCTFVLPIHLFCYPYI